jgi:hypothetical protein
VLQCRVYDAPTAEPIGGSINGFLRANPGGRVERCADRPVSYRFSEPVQRRGRLCAYRQASLRETEVAGLANAARPFAELFAGRLQTQMRMIAGAAACPAVGARGYVSSPGVSDAEFLSAMGLWNEVLAGRVRIPARDRRLVSSARRGHVADIDTRREKTAFFFEQKLFRLRVFTGEAEGVFIYVRFGHGRPVFVRAEPFII